MICAVLFRLPLLATFALLHASLLASPLAWERTHVEQRVVLGQAQLVLEYPYANSSKTPVRFLKVDTTCGCTVPEFSREAIDPGKRGSIRVVVDLQNRKGKFDGALSVYTKRNSESPDRLTFSIDVAEIVGVNPRSLTWDSGETALCKKVVVKLYEPKRARLIKVDHNGAFFTVQKEERDASDEIVFLVTPNPSKGIRNELMSIVADVDGTEVSYLVLLSSKMQ